jgi:hypothetical protein
MVLITGSIEIVNGDKLNLRCLFGRHKWSEKLRVSKDELEKACYRCGNVKRYEVSASQRFAEIQSELIVAGLGAFLGLNRNWQGISYAIIDYLKWKDKNKEEEYASNLKKIDEVIKQAIHYHSDL